MSDPISFVMPGAVPSPLNAPGIKQQPTGGGPQKTFAETLDQQKPGGATTAAPAPASPATESTQPLAEQFRLSLEKEYQRAPMAPGNPTQEMLMKQLQEVRNPISYVRDAIGGLSHTPTGTDLNGMFKGIENEWFDLEKALKTVNEFTTGGQLLGLQARLYKVAQHIEVMSKVVDQTTGGIKTVINTNI
jgi:hypothetical protein